MTSSTFSEGVSSFITADRKTLNVSIPAKIVSYNPSNQKCSCQPLVDTILKDGRRFSMPILEDIPLMFPSTKLSAMTFPINVDDTVLLVFSQRSIDTWLSSRSNATVDPADFRMHDLSDAIAIPGLFSFPQAPNDPLKHTLIHDTEDLVISHNLNTPQEAEVRIKKNGTIRLTAAGGAKLTMNLDGTISLDADTLLTVTVPDTNWVGNINQTGSFTSSVEVTANGVKLSDHTHSGVTVGGSNTGGPT